MDAQNSHHQHLLASFDYLHPFIHVPLRHAVIAILRVTSFHNLYHKIRVSDHSFLLNCIHGTN
jgi:hypothetical protein